MPFAPISSLLLAAISFINGVLVPFLLTLAFFMFLWGVFKYFINGGTSPEERQEGAKFVLWSVIGFTVIFSVWGLVWLLMNTFHFGGETRPPLPNFAPPGAGIYR